MSKYEKADYHGEYGVHGRLALHGQPVRSRVPPLLLLWPHVQLLLPPDLRGQSSEEILLRLLFGRLGISRLQSLPAGLLQRIAICLRSN